jgi:hypothetical protein
MPNPTFSHEVVSYIDETVGSVTSECRSLQNLETPPLRPRQMLPGELLAWRTRPNRYFRTAGKFDVIFPLNID